VYINWDSTAIVDYFDTTICHQGDIDFGAVTRKSFIDRVIDYFVNQVVEAAFTG
jgi:hypothetical protein